MNTLAELIPGKLYQSGLPGSIYGPTWDDVSIAGVTVVVDLMGAERPPYMGVLYVRWPFPDNAVVPNTKTLSALVDFIDDLIDSRQCVLVHCLAGMNRSAMVCALVLRQRLGLSGRQAVESVRRARHPDALFNKVFHDHVIHSL